MTMIPSLGRIVLVPCDPQVNNGATIAPAVITRVWSDKMINVRVFGDNRNDTPALTSVELVEELPTYNPTGEGMHVWAWPPRV